MRLSAWLVALTATALLQNGNGEIDVLGLEGKDDARLRESRGGPTKRKRGGVPGELPPSVILSGSLSADSVSSDVSQRAPSKKKRRRQSKRTARPAKPSVGRSGQSAASGLPSRSVIQSASVGSYDAPVMISSGGGGVEQQHHMPMVNNGGGGGPPMMFGVNQGESQPDAEIYGFDSQNSLIHSENNLNAVGPQQNKLPANILVGGSREELKARLRNVAAEQQAQKNMEKVGKEARKDARLKALSEANAQKEDDVEELWGQVAEARQRLAEKEKLAQEQKQAQGEVYSGEFLGQPASPVGNGIPVGSPVWPPPQTPQAAPPAYWAKVQAHRG